MGGTATWQALQAASQGQVLLPAPQAPTFLLLQHGGRGGQWGQDSRFSFALEAAHDGQGKAPGPTTLASGQGYGADSPSSLLRTRGKHTKHTLVTREPDWGGGGLQPSPRPQGTYLGLLRGEGLLPLLVRVDEAAQSRRNWKRRPAQRLPPAPCVPAPTPLPPAPPPVAPSVRSPPDPGPGTPILTAIPRTHDYLGSHRCPQACPLKHVSAVCVTVSVKQQKEN